MSCYSDNNICDCNKCLKERLMRLENDFYCFQQDVAKYVYDKTKREIDEQLKQGKGFIPYEGKKSN